MKKKLMMCMAALTALTFVPTQAQEYMDRDLTMTENITGVMLPTSNSKVDPKTDKATLRVINFGGEGNTIIITLDVKSVKEYDPTINMEFAWSGKDLHLVKQNQNGGVAYAIIRGSSTMCGALIKVPAGNGQYAWVAQIGGANTRCISDIHLGMNRLAVESKCKELGLSQFKFVRNDGALKVYQLQWLDMKKKRDWFGPEDYHYEVTNDKAYGTFWFDANDKLVKWLLL